MNLLHGLDLLSTFVFALVGARVAADKRLDYGGIAFIAAIASVSGGTLRNIFLGLKPIWITDPSIIASVILAVLITLVFRRVTRIGKTLLIMDTFGLAIATISGGTQLIILLIICAQEPIHSIYIFAPSNDLANKSFT